MLKYNEELVYGRLRTFIDQYFIQERDTQITAEETPSKEDITFISDNDVLKKNCLNKKKLCLLGFLDGRSNSNSVKMFDKNIKVLEESLEGSKGKPISFGWVNATCQVLLYIILD